MTLIYLDNNATTPADPRVLNRLAPFLAASFGNPSSRDHAAGWDAAEAVEEARLHVAGLINARPGEIPFTSGATESINLVLKGLVRPGQGRSGFVTWIAEHPAVLRTFGQLERTAAVAARCLAVDPAGRIDPATAEEAVARGGTLLVCLMLANNETGTVHPVTDVAEITHRAKILLLSDLTQAVGKIPVDVRALGVDLAAFSAHKMYGPKGVGALYFRGGEPQIKLEPLIVGGGQERGLRAGTVNAPGIVGFGEACRIARQVITEEAPRVAAMRDRLEREILAALPDVSINGDVENRLPNTSNLCFHGVDARTLIRDMHDIAVSTRSACSSGKPGPSHVLKAMGLSDDDAYSSIRLSLGRCTTEEEIDNTIDKVITSVRKLRSLHTAGD